MCCLKVQIGHQPAAQVVCARGPQNQVVLIGEGKRYGRTINAHAYLGIIQAERELMD